MERLGDAPAGRIEISWEGRRIEAREGDSAAAALHAAGVRAIGRSRKLHRPLGFGGSFVLGMQGEAEGLPNVRLDRLSVRPGLALKAQNAWPGQRIDLLRLARLLPWRWLRSGFEHPQRLPSGSPGFELWERALRWLAGGGRAIRPSRPGAVVPGERIAVDLAVVGGGPAGRKAAAEAAGEGRSVALISRGHPPSRFAAAMGADLPELPAEVRVLAGFEAFAFYRGARLLAAAPHDGGPAALIEASHVVLATGRRSLPPLVPGADLPGVMDLATAARLLHRHGVRPGGSACLIGTGNLSAVAQRLKEMGQPVLAEVDARALRRFRGRESVAAVELVEGKPIACDAVIHAGPWRPDPLLPFQAAADGALRLRPGALPGHVSLAGAAAEAAEPVACAALDDRAFVCPCMDVAVSEVRDLVAAGETHVEVLKRLTGCGMGPCQGTPCWDYLAAALALLTGKPVESFGQPSHRGPRAAITLAQAAGLADLVELQEGR